MNEPHTAENGTPPCGCSDGTGMHEVTCDLWPAFYGPNAESDAPCLDPECEKPEDHDGGCWVFEQCPHEVIRATCGGCNCDCKSCQAINDRIAARVIPPGKWDEDADALFIDKAREATREQDQP